jgi:hypothetical protein
VNTKVCLKYHNPIKIFDSLGQPIIAIIIAVPSVQLRYLGRALRDEKLNYPVLTFVRAGEPTRTLKSPLLFKTNYRLYP